MMYFCFASRTLPSRFPIVAAMMAAIAIFSVSADSQTVPQLPSVSFQVAQDKNAASETRGHTFPRAEGADRFPTQAHAITPLELKVPESNSGAEIAAPMAESTRLASLHLPIQAGVRESSSGADDADENDEANLVGAGPEKTYGESWRPFDALPRPQRFGVPADDDDATKMPSDRFHWKDAIYQSMMIQGVQHAYALVAQEKTRRALKGPFFRDYWNSVKAIKGWDDGNRFFTNYIAHPMQGAMTGFIFLQNHDRMKRQKFGESRQYWKDRFKAFVWSTAWSTNWELGPVSQSSIGNVGLNGAMGYVDLVMTPTAGTGWMVVEEALDRYVIRHVESKNLLIKILARTIFNPMRSVANLLRFREPWYRDRPFGH